MTAETIFDSKQDTLENVLKEIGSGRIQLPDFQRGWVWDDAHIKSLIASVSRSFPMGAVMTLSTGGEVRFQPRPIEGVTFDGATPQPDRLILDGQQRLTSLYQALVLDGALTTRDDQRRRVRRRYYVDMRKALADPHLREEAIVSVPEDGRVLGVFGRTVELDLSTPEHEYANAMFPIDRLFRADQWMMGWFQYWNYDQEQSHFFFDFKKNFIETFQSYQVPIIELRQNASKEAVCVVFEKVNTGGVSLTAFELLTATYAADNFNLREDWYGVKGDRSQPGRAARMADAHPILEALESTDFLQAVSLLHTYQHRRDAIENGAKGRDVPAVSCTRQALLNLPLEGYRDVADLAEKGLKRAARFLWREKIFTVRDIPYRTQMVPLAAILAQLGEDWENDTYQRQLRQWFWCGVFGELYGSAIESRFANDLVEVVDWLTDGGATPTTVEECNIVSERLRTLRTRNSAAYKGLHALIMQQAGAKDWRTGAGVDEQTYFDERVDIHHIFPKAWCEKAGRRIHPNIYNSIVNKTPLSEATNRMIGSAAPSTYLPRLEQRQGIPSERIDALLQTHVIDPAELRRDDFNGMLISRGQKLLRLIEDATGRAAGGPPLTEVFEVPERGDEVEDDEQAGAHTATVRISDPTSPP
jgi:hypothetical protein